MRSQVSNSVAQANAWGKYFTFFIEQFFFDEQLCTQLLSVIFGRARAARHSTQTGYFLIQLGPHLATSPAAISRQCAQQLMYCNN